MAIPYSHLYNAVILPVTPIADPAGQRFQVSASRNDRETPRYISPAWSEAELRRAFTVAGTTELQFRELLRGNRRATGGRDARRLLFTQGQLEAMGLTLDLPRAALPVDTSEHPTEAEQSVFPASNIE